MKKKITFTILIMLVTISSFSQSRYITKTGILSFSAGTPVEDIDGLNKSALSVIDVATAQVEVAVLIKGFEFKRGLMQEHFNENYMESEKYPKATFKGKIEDFSKIDFKKDGTYEVRSKGTLDLHGVKKEVEVPVTFTIAKGLPSATASFSIVLEDYKVEIPGAVKDKISKTAAVKLTLDYKPM